MVRSHARGVHFEGGHVAREKCAAEKIVQAHALVGRLPELTPEEGVVLDTKVRLDVDQVMVVEETLRSGTLLRRARGVVYPPGVAEPTENIGFQPRDVEVSTEQFRFLRWCAQVRVEPVHEGELLAHGLEVALCARIGRVHIVECSLFEFNPSKASFRVKASVADPFSTGQKGYSGED